MEQKIEGKILRAEKVLGTILRCLLSILLPCDEIDEVDRDGESMYGLKIRSNSPNMIQLFQLLCFVHICINRSTISFEM